MPRDRRRNRRRGSSPAAPPAQTAAPSAGPSGRRAAEVPAWRWRTFPVFFTFSLTLFVTATAVQIFSGTGVGWLIVFLGALFAAAALSHFVVRRFIAPRISPRRSG